MAKVAAIHQELKRSLDRLPLANGDGERADRLAEMQDVIASSEIEGIVFTNAMREHLALFAVGELSIDDLKAEFATRKQ